MSAWIFKSGRWSGWPVEQVPCGPLRYLMELDELWPPLRQIIGQELRQRHAGRRCCEWRGERRCVGGGRTATLTQEG